jgi:hypothetical protein
MALTLDVTSTEWVSVDAVMDQANVTSATSATEIELMRDAAQDAVEGLIGPVLWRTVTETVRPSWGFVALSQPPIVSVTSLLTWSGAPVSGYTTNLTSGVLTLAHNHPFYGGVLTATYVAGRTSVPAAVRAATLIIAAHLWDLQRGTSPSALAQEDYGGAGFHQVGLGYAIPNRAMDLLAPYRKPPSVA